MSPKIRPLSSIFLMLMILCKVTAAQEAKFGKIRPTELNMAVYDKDPSAEAVILFDVGIFDPDNFSFKRHLRLKVLKKSGLKWSDWTLNIPSKGDIRGITINKVNGEVIEERLKNESIQRQKIFKNFYVYKIFMPGVKVGSVIDIEYSFNGMPFEWRFQERIPVVYSRLEIPSNSNIQFKKHTYGMIPLFSSEGDVYIAKDMPSLTIEPYMSHYSNFITKFEFDLLSVHLPYFNHYEEFSKDWATATNKLDENSRFGGVIRGSTFLNSYAKEIREKHKGANEKQIVQAAYDLVRKQIKWNNVRSHLVSSDLLKDNFTKTHSGNSAEINLLLVSLLKRLKITCYPLALSTRNNGLLDPLSASLRKMNYVVAYVTIGEEKLFLDATDTEIEMGYLPERCLNLQGRIIDKSRFGWIPLNEHATKKSIVQINADISQDKAKVSRVNYLYQNELCKKFFKGFDNELQIAQKYEQTYPNISIEKVDFNFDRKDISKETYDIDISAAKDSFGNEIVFNPFYMFGIDENPFKEPERNCPVDLIYNEEKKWIITIGLPEGYQITEMPQATKATLPENSGSFTYLIQSTNRSIQIMSNLKLNKQMFTEKEYIYLRKFYQTIVAKMNESVTLTKNPR